MAVGFTFALRTTLGLNAREHFWARAKRWESERAATSLALQRNRETIGTVGIPCVVVLTRCSPRFADLDNIAGGMKAIRDEIADRLGVDDGDRERVQWLYRQEKTKEFGVRVAFHSFSRIETRIVPVGEADG